MTSTARKNLDKVERIVNSGWTDHQVRMLRTAGIDCPKRALDLLFEVCKRSGLDPFAGQVWMAERDGKWQPTATIDGLRLVAHRAKRIAIGAPEWADKSAAWTSIWTDPEQPPAACRVVVTALGSTLDQASVPDATYSATVLFHETAQFDGEGRPTRVWRERPASQLAVRAEAQALRKAAPQELSGIYTADEMNDVVAGDVVSAGPATSHLDTLLAEDD